MIDWADRLSAPLDAVRHGVDNADRSFETVHEGPLTFDRLDYPAAQVYLDEFARTASTDWTHTITVALYFEWGRDIDFSEDILNPIGNVLDESLVGLSGVDCVNNYVVNRINFFSGSPNNNLVLAVMIDLQATTLMDPGDFA